MDKINKYEELVKSFLRLNGYFVVENFILHDGNANIADSQKKIIPQSTETDILAVRFPFQNEHTGQLHVANYENLILTSELIDLVIVESKSGNANKPNQTWKDNSKIENIKYIIRFFGITNEVKIIEEIANELIKKYECKWKNYSIRYIIISETKNMHYSGKGIKYVTIEEVLDFIVKVRGECWINANMGIASHHQQWNLFMKHIFEIANEENKSVDIKKRNIRKYMEE